MTFVITQNCCKDGSCVPICPVDCIRPATPGADGTSMLYIDPDACVDCGACLAECPVGAIYFEDDLPAGQQVFLGINAGYFTEHPLRARAGAARVAPAGVEPGSLRVAIVGSGPAACYAAAELTRTDGVEVDVFERMPTPYGLVRFGVAPDHRRTKTVVSAFEPALANPNLRCYFNVTVGRDVSHQELLESHHAVIYAVGASASRRLDIPGEQLPGSLPAADFVAWYNGHPEHRDDDIDLTGRRAVIVGTGNVALDVARILVSEPGRLAGTDIAEHALKSLAHSGIEEVVILGRRGAGSAAFSVGEFLALGELPGVDIAVEGPLGDRPDDYEGGLKYDAALAYRDRAGRTGNRRIVFRFGAAPVELLGTARVQGVRLDSGDVLEAGLVLRAIGYRGTAVPGLPFDAERGVVPNDRGRVEAGVYVTGWIKRGPRGVIGTNRACARETVAALLDDFRAGALGSVTQRDGIADLLAQRGVVCVDWNGWRRIEAAEQDRGTKFVSVGDLLAHV